MDTQEKGGCCATGKSCCGKTLAAVALLAVGGLGGYFCGRHCAAKDAAAAAAAPIK